MPGRIAVVDHANRFVRWEDRRTIHDYQLVHRSVHVLVFDRAGRLVVQRRAASKQTWARYWDTSCAGHVEESDYLGGPDDALDEVHAAVAARELHEELGVATTLELVARLSPIDGLHYEQIYLYRGTSDGPFTLQPDEVEEVRRLAPDELPGFLAAERVTPLLVWLATNGFLRR